MTEQGNGPDTIPLEFSRLSEREMAKRATDFYDLMRRRRSVREFAADAVPMDIIQCCLQTAGTAPSGANTQPWHFSVVTDPEVKHQIRMGAEEEERAFYGYRASDEWLHALEPLGTTAEKPFLETAPVLIAIFAQSYSVDEAGGKHRNYYVTESVGIATGLLISALHNAGLACLTHTPSPMRFLSEILQRPANERPFLLLVVGYPPDSVFVPKIGRKDLAEYTSFL